MGKARPLAPAPAAASRELHLPTADAWPGLSSQERAYRESVLRDVRERVRRHGAHEARPHPSRARQFSPFAALKGYHELAKAKEHVPEPRQALTEEEALVLSQTLAGLCKGDVVRVRHYEGDAYAETVGAVSEVVEAHRVLRIVRKPIPFDGIAAITRLG